MIPAVAQLENDMVQGFRRLALAQNCFGHSESFDAVIVEDDRHDGTLRSFMFAPLHKHADSPASIRRCAAKRQTKQICANAYDVAAIVEGADYAPR
jgi:hypothetical protein